MPARFEELPAPTMSDVQRALFGIRPRNLFEQYLDRANDHRFGPQASDLASLVSEIAKKIRRTRIGNLVCCSLYLSADEWDVWSEDASPREWGELDRLAEGLDRLAYRDGRWVKEKANAR